MTLLDLLVMAAYFAVVLGVGMYFGGRQRDASDYFLGRHEIPWWAAMLSIVATETSALSVISAPGLAATGDLRFLQLPLGYILGRIGIAIWLLPGYFDGEQETAYQRLEARFGGGTRRLASAIFMLIRAMGDSVRVAVTAIPLAIVTGWSIPVSVAVVAAVTLAYTWAGGLSAVVWIDVVQLGIYLAGGVATILVAAHLAGGFGSVIAAAGAADKLRVVDWSLSFTTTYTLWAGIIGGALLSAASHGTDHLMVQRLLSTRDLSGARRAIVGSGLIVFVQFAVFLLVGTFLWAAGAAEGATTSDDIFPQFIVHGLPPGLSGLMVAGLLAAAMSTVSSSLNSLASAATHDFYAPLRGERDPARLLFVGRGFTVMWAVALGAGALVFRGTGQAAIELALSVASITYGGLLGTYLLGGVAPAARQRDAILGIAVGAGAMLALFFGLLGPLSELAWPWYVPLGTVITLGVGWGSSSLPRRTEAGPG